MRYLDAAGFVLRAGTNVPAIRAGDNAGDTDTARIEAALDDASAECRAVLPDDLLDATGAPVAPPPRLADALPGIVFALALYALTDGATGAEEPVAQRYHAARKLLRSLQREPDRPAVQPELVDGTSDWLPGAAQPALLRLLWEYEVAIPSAAYRDASAPYVALGATEPTVVAGDVSRVGLGAGDFYNAGWLYLPAGVWSAEFRNSSIGGKALGVRVSTGWWPDEDRATVRHDGSVADGRTVATAFDLGHPAYLFVQHYAPPSVSPPLSCDVGLVVQEDD